MKTIDLMINKRLTGRGMLIMACAPAGCVVQSAPNASDSMINKHPHPAAPVRSTLAPAQGSEWKAWTNKQAQQGTGASFVMGGDYATDGTFGTRWGSSPGRPPA